MFDRLKTFITPADHRIADALPAGRSLSPSEPAHTGAPPSVARPFTAGVRPPALRDQQLISLTLENLLHATRRLSVADLTAAAIDLKRIAYKAGKAPSELLNAADPSGGQIFDHLASTAIDVKEKLGTLLSLGCSIDKTNQQGENAMHAAARLNNVALVDALLLRTRVLSDMPSARLKQYHDATPLAVAVVHGHPEVARRLLRHSPALNAPCCRDADQAALTPQELYARLDNRSPDMSRALRTGRAYHSGESRIDI